MLSKHSTYWNTLKYLKPIQIFGRLTYLAKGNKRKGRLACPVWRNVKIAIPELDGDERVHERFGLEQLIRGEVNLLHQTVKVDFSPEYQSTLKPLIQFNLQYFEYAVVLAAKYAETKDCAYLKLFKQYYSEYLDSGNPVNQPYVIALHIPNILIALELFGNAIDDKFKQRIYSELYTQYKFLENHLEVHLLANHYFEDLKALTIASYVFGEDKRCKKYLNKLKDECKEQILADGMHYELSPMYHKIIWEDLLRVYSVLADSDFDIDWLKFYISEMASAGAFWETGIDRTPLFNDSGDNVAKPFVSLALATKRMLGQEIVQKDSLPNSGNYRLDAGKITAIIDCGKVGVDYQPGHGHSDCLSFELFIDGKPLFVNQGTLEYQGEYRGLLKKTSAHNTVMIDGHEQNEVWSAFRVARRISNIKPLKYSSNHFAGEFSNLSGEIHHRNIALDENFLTVLDSIMNASTGACIKSFLHLAPEYILDGRIIKSTKTGKTIAELTAIYCECEYATDGDLSIYAPEFGLMQKGSCLTFTWYNDDKEHGYKVTFI